MATFVRFVVIFRSQSINNFTQGWQYLNICRVCVSLVIFVRSCDIVRRTICCLLLIWVYPPDKKDDTSINTGTKKENTVFRVYSIIWKYACNLRLFVIVWYCLICISRTMFCLSRSHLWCVFLSSVLFIWVYFPDKKRRYQWFTHCNNKRKHCVLRILHYL